MTDQQDNQPPPTRIEIAAMLDYEAEATERIAEEYSKNPWHQAELTRIGAAYRLAAQKVRTWSDVDVRDFRKYGDK